MHSHCQRCGAPPCIVVRASSVSSAVRGASPPPPQLGRFCLCCGDSLPRSSLLPSKVHGGSVRRHASGSAPAPLAAARTPPEADDVTVPLRVLYDAVRAVATRQDRNTADLPHDFVERGGYDSARQGGADDEPARRMAARPVSAAHHVDTARSNRNACAARQIDQHSSFSTLAVRRSASAAQPCERGTSVSRSPSIDAATWAEVPMAAMNGGPPPPRCSHTQPRPSPSRDSVAAAWEGSDEGGVDEQAMQMRDQHEAYTRLRDALLQQL